ncbi:hypothetical protein TNCV_3114701 [Trichonephila clavipes]|nr:hypothetical protein TNCV_3114701 [Trichonephila clavipes]
MISVTTAFGLKESMQSGPKERMQTRNNRQSEIIEDVKEAHLGGYKSQFVERTGRGSRDQQTARTPARRSDRVGGAVAPALDLWRYM